MKCRKLLLTFVSTILLTGCAGRQVEISDSLYMCGDVLTKSGYIYTADYTSTEYYDFAAMDTSYYCSKANCMHSDSSCMSRWFDGNLYGPIPYAGKVYYFSPASEQWSDTDDDGREDRRIITDRLLCYDIENDMTKTVCEWEGTQGYYHYGAYLSGSMLYFIGEQSYVEFAELPGLNTPETIPMENRLYCVNLETGELKEYGSLYSDDLQYEDAWNNRSMKIMGESEGKLYICYAYLQEDTSDIESGDFLTIDDYTELCFTLDLATDEISMVDEPAPEIVKDGYRCHTEDEGTAVIVKESKNWEIQAEEWDFRYGNLSIADDKLWHLGNGDSWYYDLVTEKKVDVKAYETEEYTGIPVQVLTKYNDYYICKFATNGQTIFDAIPVSDLT